MRKADNLPPYRAVVMKSGSLNLLEPSGPAQACYGRTLPFFTSHLVYAGTGIYQMRCTVYKVAPEDGLI